MPLMLQDSAMGGHVDLGTQMYDDIVAQTGPLQANYLDI